MSLANVVKYDLLYDILDKQDQYQSSSNASKLVRMDHDQILVGDSRTLSCWLSIWAEVN